MIELEERPVEFIEHIGSGMVCHLFTKHAPDIALSCCGKCLRMEQPKHGRSKFGLIQRQICPWCGLPRCPECAAISFARRYE